MMSTNSAKPARERIYDYVREQILRGALKGGSFVEEEQISTAMGVSRTPVREAFHRLQAERFIDLLPRRGALVREVTAIELVQLYETRRLIEGHSVTQICEKRLKILPGVEATLHAMHKNLEQIDLYEHVELDRQFHRLIVASAGNSVTSDLYDSLGARQQRVAMAACTANPGRIRRILEQHTRIFDRLAAYDCLAARQALDDHLQPVSEVTSLLPGGFAVDPAS